MSVHPDEIIFCEKSSTKQIFYPRQKIKLDRLAISTKRDVKYFKKESHLNSQFIKSHNGHSDKE